MLYVVDMPLDKDGKGPAEPWDTVKMTFEVWTEDYVSVASFDTLEEALEYSLENYHNG